MVRIAWSWLLWHTPPRVRTTAVFPSRPSSLATGIDKAQAIGDVAKRAGQTVQVTIGDKVVMEYDIRNVITFAVENSNSPTPRL